MAHDTGVNQAAFEARCRPNGKLTWPARIRQRCGLFDLAYYFSSESAWDRQVLSQRLEYVSTLSKADADYVLLLMSLLKSCFIHWESLLYSRPFLRFQHKPKTMPRGCLVGVPRRIRISPTQESQWTLWTQWYISPAMFWAQWSHSRDEGPWTNDIIMRRVLDALAGRSRRRVIFEVAAAAKVCTALRRAAGGFYGDLRYLTDQELYFQE